MIKLNGGTSSLYSKGGMTGMNADPLAIAQLLSCDSQGFKMN